MAVRLRYLAHDLEVPPGEFVIGRSPESQLSLDDALVSRRHALLVVSAGSVTVQDLGSRNGVIVNDKKIEGVHPLRDEDKITIGAQDLSIHITDTSSWRRGPGDSKRGPIATLVGRKDNPAQTLEPGSVVILPSIKPEIDEDFTTTGIQPLPTTTNPDKRVHALSLIGGVADKALALNRADEAEKILQRALNDLLAKARTGPLEPAVAERAATFAIRLADSTGRGQWVDYVFDLYICQRAVLPGPLVDELYRVVRKVDALDLPNVVAYVEVLRRASGAFGPAERFLLSRIEGLERLGALK